MKMINALLMLIVITVVVAGVMLAETGNIFLILTVPAVTLAILEYGFDVPIIAAITSDWVFTASCILGYLLVGVLFAILYKWPRYLKLNKESIIADYKKWENSSVCSSIPFEDSVYYRQWSTGSNKQRILSWTFSWPFSAAWDLTYRPITALWDGMYDMTKSLMQAVERRVINSILKQHLKDK